jgi:steroid delta-isomerase-like uncharacterized protein
MSREELIRIANAGVEAYNAKDWDAAREMMAPGFVYDEVATGRKVKGVEDVLSLWRGWAKAFPDSTATFEEPLVDGNAVVQRLRWRGTHSGPLSLPTGEILPTGKEIDFRACQISRIENGETVETRHYFDLLTMMAQIGEAPEKAAKAEVRAKKR